MPWNLDPQRPIYAQIIERVQLDIVTGHYAPGSRLPSVRELAAQAAVNPNTMQRALSELEGSGLIYAQRTSGRFVTEDTARIRQAKEKLASMQVREFIRKMQELGMNREEIAELFQEIIREEELCVNV